MLKANKTHSMNGTDVMAKPNGLSTLGGFLTDVEVAEFLGLSVATVRRWRLLNQGPLWVRVSKSAIRYRQEDLLAWVQSRPTGGMGPRAGRV